MPRKAKPLRMWAIKAPGGHLTSFAYTRRGAKDDLALMAYGSPTEWPTLQSAGYRAVRVTVREEVK